MNQPRYTIIAKCSLEPEDYKKWRNVTNLISFVRFLDDKHSQWKFLNVYDKETREQLAYFTPKDKPSQKTLIF